jgi:hypothetical protein
MPAALRFALVLVLIALASALLAMRERPAARGVGHGMVHVSPAALR